MQPKHGSYLYVCSTATIATESQSLPPFPHIMHRKVRKTRAYIAHDVIRMTLLDYEFFHYFNNNFSHTVHYFHLASKASTIKRLNYNFFFLRFSSSRLWKEVSFFIWTLTTFIITCVRNRVSATFPTLSRRKKNSRKWQCIVWVRELLPFNFRAVNASNYTFCHNNFVAINHFE